MTMRRGKSWQIKSTSMSGYAPMICVVEQSLIIQERPENTIY
jgi:hypothetical protein